MDNVITQLKEIVDASERIVFFTGAGVSVASGIPDFRSAGGLYDAIEQKGASPEYLLSHDYLREDPVGFMEFCHQYLLFADKKPNPVHEWMAQLEAQGHSLGVITQNIDGLHSDAGSQKVDELHGTLNRFYCIQDSHTYTKSEVIDQYLLRCPESNGPIRPDIVLYGEMLNEQTIFSALNKLQKADTLIVLGSSLLVQPASGLISNFTGQNLVIINRDPTPFDRNAQLVIHDDMVSVIKQLQNHQ
ncbi:NAD-dependent protein deacylase [Staphylococcus muscae]|uniref:NAD-dependent protein deacetylase n=1 Tax=Staphylococcus muscae TaxID=1294 RepID=A0A240BSB7_9STAP|nr:NAD-dependent protein deacylase [Staphylococcus muscae]AVQ34039.1 NAD-dependent protein deacylase [Staphylococcus muscae]PNY98141.1 NAD-dependent protein deacylase [Staphylococcus muscae]GGA82257.1 NAD-dependent protein deacetylase [Staphylococcus muscae]SNV98490.1 NAD-dependent deacetylase [Staphylococcus muscae]